MMQSEQVQPAQPTAESLVGELTWLVSQAQEQLQTLQNGGSPIIHNMLLQNIGKGIAWRSVRLAIVAEEAMKAAPSLLPSVPDVA